MARGLPETPPAEVQSRVLQQLMDEVIAPPQRRLSTQKQPQKCVDFSFDAEEIYSSFRQAYGVDLIQECGRLHWCAFLAMFHGLPEDAPVKQIMRIRSEDIPAPNKHNAEYIRRLTELKTLYALPNKGASQAQDGGGWDGLSICCGRRLNDFCIDISDGTCYNVENKLFGGNSL